MVSGPVIDYLQVYSRSTSNTENWENVRLDWRPELEKGPTLSTNMRMVTRTDETQGHPMVMTALQPPLELIEV